MHFGERLRQERVHCHLLQENLDLLQHWLPAQGQGFVLITTRRQALGTLAWSIDVAPMEQEEGILFVPRRAKVLEPETDHIDLRQLALSKPAEYATASALVNAMDGLPLALDQAGAYIEEAGCSLADYLERYKQQYARLLERRGIADSTHPESVTATFLLASEQVEREDPVAANLLRLCTFLHAEAIPEEFLRKGAAYLGPEFAPLVTDPSRLDQALITLRRLSLVQRQKETHTLSTCRGLLCPTSAGYDILEVRIVHNTIQ